MAELLPPLQTALADRYTIEGELGRGGMGVVYRAWDVKHARPVALKVVRPELASVLAAERFHREIQLAAKLHHPHIVPLYDSGDAAGALFYVMPLVEGESLRARLQRERQLPLDEALQITREVADALGYAHSHDVLHRDIKPENILLSGGHAVVVDFGIGRAITAAGGERLTESGISVGTPAYMSPEQATGDTQLDGRSDLYSLACVLYELLAGHPPFLGATAQEVIVRHTLDPVPSLRSARPGVPPPVEQVVTKALAKVPADRFATVVAFAAALEQAITAPPEPDATTTPRTSRKRRIFAGLGALGVVVVGIIALWLRPQPVYDPGRVVVAPPESVTGDSTLAEFTRQFTASLPDAIAREGVADPVPTATVRDLLPRIKGSPGEVAARLARETRAGLELRSACSRGAAGSTCQVDLLRMPAKLLRMSVSATGDPGQPRFQADLTERVLIALLLQQEYGDRATWLGEYIPRSLAAVRAYEEAWRTGDWKYMNEAARLDTGWAEAAARAAFGGRPPGQADTARLRRLASRPGLLPGEREAVEIILNNATPKSSSEQYFQLVQRRAAVNPERWLVGLTGGAVMTGRDRTALAISSLADSAVHLRGERLLAVYLARGYALHDLGQYREELQLARDLERRFPTGSQLQAHTHLVMAWAALGQVDSLRRRLAEWEATPEGEGWLGTRAYVAGMELMAHGSEREGREVLERALPLYRRLGEEQAYTPEEAINILEWTDHLEEARRLALAALPKLRSWDDSTPFLGALGRIAARQERRGEALRYDRLLATPPGSPLDQAPIATLLGDRERAVRLLEEARENGPGNDFAGAWNVHRNPSFAPLRDYPPFQRFLRPRDAPSQPGH